MEEKEREIQGYLDVEHYVKRIQDLTTLGLHNPIGVDWEIAEAHLNAAIKSKTPPNLTDLEKDFDWVMADEFELSKVFQVDDCVFPFKYAFVEREYLLPTGMAICALHAFDEAGDPVYLENYAGFANGFAVTFKERSLFFVNTNEQTILSALVECLEYSRTIFELGRANRPLGTAWNYQVIQKGKDIEVRQLQPSSTNKEELEGAVTIVINMNKIVENPKPKDLQTIHELIVDLGAEFLYTYYGTLLINQSEFDCIQRGLEALGDEGVDARAYILGTFEKIKDARFEQKWGEEECAQGYYLVTTDLTIEPIYIDTISGLANCVMEFLKHYYRFKFEAIKID